MHYGLHIALTDRTIDPCEVGRLAEDAGFESLFLPEHTHIPARGASVHPSGPGMHDHLRRFADPLVALGAIAGVTQRIRLGTGVCLVTQHDPIALAKQVATLDLISNGRFLFGIGAGWNREEMRNHGTDPTHRWAVMRERVLAMRRIWTDEEAEFHGRFVDFGPIWQWPKPVQRPHPPVIVGGEGPRVLERVVDYGDEWGPNDEPGVAERIPELQRLARERGRGPIPVTVFHVAAEPDAVARYVDAGATRCIFTLPGAGADEVWRALDRLVAFVARHP